MIREVLTIGDKRLLQVSEPVKDNEFGTEELISLIKDMEDTKNDKGGVGIAAIQIGYHKRIMLIGYDSSNPRYCDIGDCPLTVIINPQIKVLDSQKSDYNEGCLSVPDTRGIVSRPKHISYQFYNQYGELVTGENDGFFARVMQHEIDHLDGVLFPSRVEDKSTLKATNIG